MNVIYNNLFFVLWIGWAVYWRLTSQNVKANIWRESWTSRLPHIAGLVVAGLLLCLPSLTVFGLDVSRWYSGVVLFWVGALITAAGLAFSVWARVNIGRNWSGSVTLKEGHELITKGPYRLVRHPIYTGLLLGFVGSAIARGDAQGVVAVFIAFVTLWFKLRFEERGMRRQFGDAYEDYARRVPALVPFIR